MFDGEMDLSSRSMRYKPDATTPIPSFVSLEKWGPPIIEKSNFFSSFTYLIVVNIGKNGEKNHSSTCRLYYLTNL